MFDKLEDLLIRFDEVLNELGEPGVTDNQERFQKLMKEQSDLLPIVDAYKEYKENKETIQDSLSMLEEEKDEEMREMLKEELSDAKKRVEELEHEIKILLLPKDPNDSKNVIVEIRAGAGGDEAALFAAEIYDTGAGCILPPEIRKRSSPCTACAGDRIRRKDSYLYLYGSHYAGGRRN